MSNIVYLQYILHLTYMPVCRKVAVNRAAHSLLSSSGINQTT